MSFNPVGALHAFCSWLTGQWKELKDWLGPDVDAVAGKINFNELIKVVVFALTNGGLVTLLQALLSASSVIFIDPSLAGKVSAAIMVLTAVIDYIRRRRQGAVVPPPAQKVEPPHGQ